MLISLALLAGLSVATSAQAQAPVWKGADGKPVQETEAMKSKDGFAGSLLVTSDEDWQQKWDTPAETKPSFTQASTVAYGKKIFVLTFFSNPKPNAQGLVNIRCDMQLIAPNGEVKLDQKDVTCFAGKIAGSPFNLYRVAPVLAFSGDPGDPAGTWQVRMSVRDAVRNVTLPLSTSFSLVEK
jgi:hypothetical protein